MRKIKMIMTAVVMFVVMMPQVMAERPLYYVGCGDVESIPVPVPQMTSIAYTLLIIGTPLILIAFSVVALSKAVTAGKADEIMKAKSKLMKKLLAGLLVFLVAGFSQFILTRAGDDSERSTIASCMSCFLYSSGCHPSENPLPVTPAGWIAEGPAYTPNPGNNDPNGTYNPINSNCLTSGSYNNGNGNDPDPRCPIRAMGKNESDFVYPSDSNGKSLGAWPANHQSLPSTHPNPTTARGDSSVIIPVAPNSSGGYSGSYEHGGRDFATSFGAPVYAPADGTLSYSTWGHTRNKGYNETSYSINLRLSTPITVDGKTVNSIFMTHLSGIRYRCSNSDSTDVNCNVSVKKGDLLGYNGTANSTPHVHFGFCASTGDPNCAIIRTTAINNFFGI